MGIDVNRETERGEQQDAVLDPKGLLPKLLDRSRKRHWRLIQYIDPYGDSVFNQRQIPALLDDFSKLKDHTESDDERAFLKAVLDLIERTENKTHTYVKFCGD